MYVLNIRIDEYSREEALDRAHVFLHSKDQYTLFTPNPEMLVAAQRDSIFRDALNRGSLNICDGMGIELFLRGKIKRVAGIDLMNYLCAIAEREEKKIYLLGTGDSERVRKAANRLRHEYPKLAIVGAHPGISMSIERQNEGYSLVYEKLENDRMIHGINTAQPDILFVAFGHQKQERWIDENLATMPSVKIAMGVGGALDVIAGRTLRAPVWMRKLGFEWLWRFFLEPRRIGRIWNATAVFLWYATWSRIFTKKHNEVTTP